MKLKVLITTAVVAAALPAFGRGNIIRNGNFEAGRGGKFGFPGWHTAIMGFMPKIVGKDDDGKNLYNYICSCGHNFGPIKPEAGVVCPKCGRYGIAEETGGWYDQNHEYVKLGPGREGYGVKMTLSKSVGENQGVRCVSDLVRVQRNWPYKFRVDARAKGAVILVFVEGYRYVYPKTGDIEDDEDEDEDDDEDEDEKKEDKVLATQGEAIRIEKCYRKQMKFGSPGGWTRKEENFMPPKRYEIDLIQVKLYAFMPGEAHFDNVLVRPLSTYEAEKWLRTRKRKKDKRFR